MVIKYLIFWWDCKQNNKSSYENPELSITCGLIIREIFRIDDITISFFKSSHLDTFFSVLLVSPNFDVVSDAFSTFKQALTTNKTLVAQCLSPTGEVYTKVNLISIPVLFTI